MTRAETSVAAALGAPAWAFASDLAGGVHAKTADGHENMLTRLHPDGDEAAFTSLAVVGETLGGEGSLEEASLDQGVAGGAGAVISTIFDAAMTGTAEVNSQR